VFDFNWMATGPQELWYIEAITSMARNMDVVWSPLQVESGKQNH
jgi:hypothetical protein